MRFNTLYVVGSIFGKVSLIFQVLCFNTLYVIGSKYRYKTN